MDSQEKEREKNDETFFDFEEVGAGWGRIERGRLLKPTRK